MDFLMNLFGGTSLGTGLFGSPGAGTLFNDMSIPGMPASGGLLRAGTDDMMPAAPAAPGAGLLERAGGEGLGLSRSVGGLLGDSANTPAPGAQPMQDEAGGFVVPGTGQVIKPGGPGDRTPISIPNSVGGPDARGEPGGVGGAARDPVPGGQPPITPVTTPATTPAGTPVAKEEQLTPFQKFAASLSKLKAGGAGQQQGLKPAQIGSPGQPHIPQGAQQLMEAIMSGRAKAMAKVGPVPELPPGLLHMFRG